MGNQAREHHSPRRYPSGCSPWLSASVWSQSLQPRLLTNSSQSNSRPFAARSLRLRTLYGGGKRRQRRNRRHRRKRNKSNEEVESQNAESQHLSSKYDSSDADVSDLSSPAWARQLMRQSVNE